jgi:hypothetical protein
MKDNHVLNKSVGIWIRVSTEDQAKGESPAQHLERAKSYANARGWTVKEVYDLAGISGKSVKEHPEARRMLADIKPGHITGVIFSKLARLSDCQWLQYLHSVGLLRASFRPPEHICAVRSLFRHRAALTRYAGSHIQHIQKALTQMNLQIRNVISDLTGITGLAILQAILAGERDPQKLAALKDHRIKASRDTLAHAYLPASDPAFVERTWQAVMEQLQSRGNPKPPAGSCP